MTINWEEADGTDWREEYKELKVNSAKLKAAFDDREILTKENLKHFHVDDDE